MNKDAQTILSLRDTTVSGKILREQQELIWDIREALRMQVDLSHSQIVPAINHLLERAQKLDEIEMRILEGSLTTNEEL